MGPDSRTGTAERPVAATAAGHADRVVADTDPTSAAADWHEANQTHLMAALAVVRAALERFTAARDGHADGAAASRGGGAHGRGAEIADEELARAERRMPAPSALDALSASFGLTPFERAVLLLAAGPELDSSFAGACAAAHGDVSRPHPTFALALATLDGAHWSALSPNRALRRWRLIEPAGGDTLVGSPLRLPERVLHHLTGVPAVEERLEGLVEPLGPPADLPPSHRALAERVADAWSGAAPPEPPVVAQLCARDAEAARRITASACATLGLRGFVIRAADLPGAAGERDALLRLWEREAVLSAGALLVELDASTGREGLGPALALVERMGGMVATSAREPLALRHRRAHTVDVEAPTVEERETMWRDALGPVESRANGALAGLASQFRLGQAAIQSASATALRNAAGGERALPEALWRASRLHARPRLEGLAHRTRAVATWADLVLPELQVAVLREIAAHSRRRERVYGDWGFADKGSRGLGVSALFAGASGTGKTMAGEVLANELDLDLYRIDLSQVVSKYIGETEKNLRAVFDAAEDGGAILLFDEADALFGKRSEVKDSHDRYANIEVSYLLQRMEEYHGLAVLTTNMKDALDPAFLRRIRFVVHFPFPAASERAEIWRRVFPEETPTDGLDAEALARLDVAGGNIRNIAVSAAFLAADRDEAVGMRHVLHAARTEYAKLEKALSQAEIGGWA